MADGRRILVLGYSQTPNTSWPYCFHHEKEKKGRQRGDKFNERSFFSSLSFSHISVLNDISLRFTDRDFFADESRQLAFPLAFFFAHKRLKNHTIRTVNVLDKDLCELQCYKELNCININFKIPIKEKGKAGGKEKKYI